MVAGDACVVINYVIAERQKGGSIMTNREFYEALLSLSEVKASPALKAKAEHNLKVVVDKASKDDPKKKENASLEAAITTHFQTDNTPMTCTDLLNTGKFNSYNKEAGMNIPRISSRCNDMVKAGNLKKEYKERDAYFHL